MIQNYSDPIVTLNQVYRALETGENPVLGACIIGPNYLVREYEDLGEKLRLDSDENYPIGSNSASVNVFSYQTGLSARALPGQLRNDKEFKDVEVFVKNAKLLYAGYSSNSASFISDSTATDILQIKVGGSFIKFNDLDSIEDVFAVGDEVLIELSDSGSGSGYSQVCQITGFLQDETTGYYTKCILSKPVKVASTDTVKKISFFKYKDCYVNEGKRSFNNDLLTITGYTTSAPISLAEEEATAYPIYDGAFYAEYRAFSTRYSSMYGQISSLDFIEETLGKISAKNPLGIAVASALQEAEGSFVYFVALDSDPSDEKELVNAYDRAAAIIADVEGIHGIVPCTNNKAVLKSLLNFVETQSAEQVPYFKFLYGSADIQDKYLVEETKDTPCIITRSASDSLTTIELTKTVLPTTTEVFVKGDYIGYGVGQFAEIVACDNKKILKTRAVLPIGTNTPISLYKALRTASEIVDALIEDKDVFNKRASIVFADDAMYDGKIPVPNYCVAANLAGLRSISAPHAPLSNIVLKGITCAETHGITKKLSDKLGSYGFWRVGNDLEGNCISKRQLTSAATGDVNYDEQSIVTNIDSICLDLKTTGRAYVGNTNISGALLDILENLLKTKLDKYERYTDSLIGPQLLSSNLISIEQDPVYKDRIYASLEGEPPKPFNRFHITFYML